MKIVQELGNLDEKVHSVRYNRLVDDKLNAPLASIYIMKTELPIPFPSRIKVTIVEVE